MVKGGVFRKRLIATRNGCDKKCKECVLYFSSNRCVYEAMKSYYKWAEKQHKNFGEYLDSYATRN